MGAVEASYTELPNKTGERRGVSMTALKKFLVAQVLKKFLVAQASRLCCEQSVFSRTGETPVPRL